MISYSGCFDFFKSKLNNLEFLHLSLNFISQHSIYKSMSQENFSPVLFIKILILNSSFSNFNKLSLSKLVSIKELKPFLYHILEIAYMCFTLLFFSLKLFRELFINFRGSVFWFKDLMPLFFENIQLLFKIRQLFIHIKFSLVIENSINFMSTLEIQ